MIKRIIVFVLVVWVAFLFYKKFMAGILEPFFRDKAGNVDFLQHKVPDYKIESE